MNGSRRTGRNPHYCNGMEWRYSVEARRMIAEGGNVFHRRAAYMREQRRL